MHATVRAFWLPKAGNSPSDYEDAFWPRARKPLDRRSSSIRLAIGDGATEASFSGLWARLLVGDYGRGHLKSDSLQERLQHIQLDWRRRVARKPLPWYAEEKLRDGAFSSLLGLTLEEDSSGQGLQRCWQAMAIGDSCLAHVRGGKVVDMFPLDRSELFTTRPLLVSSEPSRNSQLHDALVVKDGQWEDGDVFYLMTDALACWFLKCREQDGDPLSKLNGVTNQDKFEELVVEHRKKMLKNDDVTLVRCLLRHPE